MKNDNKQTRDEIKTVADVGASALFRPFFLFCGITYYPRGGFADFSSAHATLEEAIQAAESVFKDASTEWAEVVDVRLAARIYSLGEL